ncbi:hypothetical protein NQ314_003814 [Rhamnusium bicolor]|uniref:RING-type E3 ubiquitin transferase n=1 Tax=Rhamnusium bicolor TaxID=1586634 RepID=A0AAV8ZLC3_9CUCU|nr:hypothetical protein NQ314_003814 [Rhamnusium bicolor]
MGIGSKNMSELVLPISGEIWGTFINCAICKDILKPPIMLTEITGNVCLTCYEGSPEVCCQTTIKNCALETILQMIKLPCRFKINGCEVALSHEALICHQEKCKYRTKRCPLVQYSGCQWEGSTADFVDHFTENHGDHIINFDNNLFYLQTSLTDLNLIKLLVMKNRTYVLRMQTDLTKGKLFYIICNVKKSNRNYEYSVKHKGNSENYIKTKGRIVADRHIYNDFIEEVAINVDLGALKQVAQVSDTVTNVFKINVGVTQNEGINEKMLPFFECPVCKNFMKPPIYQCESGHSICNFCRSRVEKCPTCRSMFGTTRNYSLEGLTSGIQYPCVYHDLGCTEAFLVNDISKHENECPFKQFNCPFHNCTSTGNQQAIVHHLKHFHPQGVISSGTCGYIESFHLDPNVYYNKVFDRKCVIAYNHIFRLTCKRIPEHCLWAAEIFGSYDRSKTFVYEVSIIDMQKPEKRLIRTDHCLEEMREDDLFQRCIMFPNSILTAFSVNGMVTFHFTIKEK